MHAKGRVGQLKADLSVWQCGDKLRVDCANNLAFWLTLNTTTMEIEGRMVRVTFGGGPRFVAVKTASGYRVDSLTEPTFWLEINV